MLPSRSGVAVLTDVKDLGAYNWSGGYMTRPRLTTQRSMFFHLRIIMRYSERWKGVIFGTAAEGRDEEDPEDSDATAVEDDDGPALEADAVADDVRAIEWRNILT